MKRLVIVCLFTLAAVAACGDAETTRDDVPGQPGWTIHHDRPDDQFMAAECGELLEPDWFREYPTFWYEPTFFGFSPNSGLLLRADSMVARLDAYRTVDGEQFHSDVGPQLHAIDSSWRYVARSQAYTRNVDVFDLRTDETVATVQVAGERAQVISAAFGPRAETVAVATCRDQVPYLTVWSLADDAPVVGTRLGTNESCNGYYSPAPRLEYTPDGEAVVVSLAQSGELAHVDLRTGELTSVLAHQPHEADEEMLPIQGILDLAVHPSGRLVATSGARGNVRLWKLPSLERVGEDIPAGVAPVNINTYAPPHRVSPLAWSADGSLLAAVSEGGEVVLRERTGEVVSTLHSPEVDPQMPDVTTQGQPNPAMTIAFDPHGRIAVGSYYSMGRWSCGQAEIEHAEGELDVNIELDGPAELRAGERGVFHARIHGAENPVVLRFLVDGVKQHGPQAGGSWNWYAREPGTYRVRLEVDDGSSSASKETTVIVTESGSQ